MTETITVAPVVKSVHVDCGDRARVRGVHPRHRLVVAARPASRFTPARCSEVTWEERAGGEVFETSNARRAVALGDGPRLGAAGGLHARLAGRSRRGCPDRGRRPLHARSTTGRDVVLEHRHWDRLGAAARRDARRATTAAGTWCSVATSPGSRSDPNESRRMAACSGDSPQTPTSIGCAGGPSRRSDAHELGQAAGSEMSPSPPRALPASTSAARTRTRRSAAPRRGSGSGVNAGARTRWYCSCWPSHWPPMNGTMCRRVQTTGPISAAVEPGLLERARGESRPRVSRLARSRLRESPRTIRPGNSKRTSRIRSSGSSTTARAAGRIRSSLNDSRQLAQRREPAQPLLPRNGGVRRRRRRQHEERASRRAAAPGDRAPARSRNGPRYASLPTNAITPGRSSRASASSRSALPAKSPARRSPEPGVVR